MRSFAEVGLNTENQSVRLKQSGRQLGLVAGIFIGPVRGEPMHAVAEVRAIPGEGLEGDRKRVVGIPRKQVTLIESEALAAAVRDYGIEIIDHESRRNLLTQGVALNHLVGREFSVGEVRLHGLELCEPCSHLERLTGKQMIKALTHRGGLRAQILEGGVIRVGDIIGEAE